MCCILSCGDLIESTVREPHKIGGLCMKLGWHRPALGTRWEIAKDCCPGSESSRGQYEMGWSLDDETEMKISRRCHVVLRCQHWLRIKEALLYFYNRDPPAAASQSAGVKGVSDPVQPRV